MAWQIWIDTGGTFTDCLGLAPDGVLHRVKVLSSGALRGRAAAVDGRRVTVEQSWGVGDHFVRGFRFRWLDLEHEPVAVAAFSAHDGVMELAEPPPPSPASDVFELTSGVVAPLLAARMVTRTPPCEMLPPIDLRLATTRGTNALLEREGAETALFVTEGFADLLAIGDQQRPDLFALNIVKPTPLASAVVEVGGRLAADGRELRPLDLEPALNEARDLLERGVRVAAVALLHGYRNAAHERALAVALREAGFDHVSCSAELSPLIKIVPRAETAVANAYLSPRVEAYLADVGDALGGGRLHVMTSAGGLVGAASCHAKDMLLSGPAGGVAGVAAVARRCGLDRVIGLDMGGTSTDVARWDGDFDYRFEHTVGGVRLATPALAIETVAAGGGSICSIDESGLRVGPESASADPGPACYGAGGPLTLTDVNLLLGRLDPDRFGIPVSRDAAARALDALGVDDRDATLHGFLEIANQRMADAIAEVSVRRGYDPSEYALVAFGGAGGQHACAVADHLGITTVIMPPDASLLSALGLGTAVVERFAHRQVLQRLDEVESDLEGMLDELGTEAVTEVSAEGVDGSVRRRIVRLRLLGQDATIEVPGGDDLRGRFAERYEAMYGHHPEGRPIEVESIRVVASSQPDTLPAAEPRSTPPTTGPGLIVDEYSAYVIEPGWTCTADETGALIATRSTGTRRPSSAMQELFTSRLASTARQMGRMLERTALSTNVKERLDFSCAILDHEGELIVHAPHMPVHLGALGLCVRALREIIEMGPGDVVITNHPAHGGSHVPDVTVVTPAYHDGELLGYLASRAHHAEIGGTRPGSMPPRATCLAEEGVVIPPMHLVRGGRSCFDDVERLLDAPPWPSRAPNENLADLRAQVAANTHGATALAALAADHGPDGVRRGMAELEDRAERLARRLLSGLPDGRREARQTLDDGALIQVAIDVTGDHAVFDFAGTSAVHPGNLNATPAIVRSAVIYVLRVLIGEGLPLNEGLMRAVDVRISPGMLDPDFPEDPNAAPAVGGGNVETSQRVVDTLLLALGVCAASQGTMNNTLFGNDQFSYYETVCGGSGAGPGFDGVSAVHTHMTNTRITDPEIIEHRYPVRLDRFAIRANSGGAGRHRGGDGVVREITFLEPASLTVLTQHRTEGPYGLDGGAPGQPGAQHLVRADGTEQPLASIDGAEVEPGDRLILETPGGGGWGLPA